MPEYLNVVWEGDPICVPVSDRTDLPGQWISVQFDRDISDAGGNHTGDSPLLGKGRQFIQGVLDLTLRDFQTGVEIQIRQYETDAEGTRLETHKPHEFNTSPIPVPVGPDGEPLFPRTTHHRYPVFSYINAGHRFGIELSQWPVDLTAPAGKILEAQFVGQLTAA